MSKLESKQEVLEQQPSADLQAFLDMPRMTLEEFGNLKPSEALELALRDLEATERNPTRYIDMGVWKEPREGPRAFMDGCVIGHIDNIFAVKPNVECIVCMAGSVMDRTLNISFDTFRNANATPWRTHLGMISAVAVGVRQVPGVEFVEYRKNREKWKEHVRAVIKDFRGRGQ